MNIIKFVHQGDIIVSNDPNITITTILGSCITVCLYDEKLKIGGMNHFFLPYCTNNCRHKNKYGEWAIPNLIDKMIKAGAIMSNITAKIYGGAKVIKSSQDIGELNIQCAVKILNKYNIPIKIKDIKKKYGRKINFSINLGKVSVNKTEEIDI